MALDYILRRVATEAGYTDYTNNPAQRTFLLDIVNEAAREIYRKPDIPVSLEEVYVRVNSNKQIALPTFVGELRAIRDVSWDGVWKIHDMRPRYHTNDWPNKWKVWRIIGYKPIMVEYLNIAPGSLEYPEVDNDLTVTLVGKTANSNRATDNIVMSATTTNWLKSFLSIDRISKNKITNYDLIIKDPDGTEISIIYADQIEARFLIVDVSQYPTNVLPCPDGTYVMEVLYKPRLNYMSLDTDSFPVDGYDDVIVLKAKQLILEGEEGKENRAILMHQKAQTLVTDIREDKTGTIEKKLKFKRNSKLGLFDRYNCNRNYAD